mgnify:CR=1 FL=1
MPEEFKVFSLGQLDLIDPTEGNNTAEDADLLEGLTFGGIGDALLNSAQDFSAGSTGFGAGSSTSYDQDNAGDTFSINGGPDQIFDAAVAYRATITYIDGTTEDITAVVFQDTAGNTYLAPEFSGNQDQTDLEFAAIRSLTLNSLQTGTATGLRADRQAWAYVTCYVSGTLVATDTGDRPIDDLCVGDMVETRDNGLQAIRWIGKSTVSATGNLAPVRISSGALGQNAPNRDLLVSRQHRMLISSPICQRMFDSAEILVPAIKLTELPGVFVEERETPVTYYHLMTDQHDIIYAESVPSETLLTGPQAIEALPEEALDELLAIFPDILKETPEPARPIEHSKRISRMIMRHKQNAIPLTGARD